MVDEETEEGEKQQRERLNKIRKQTLLEITQTLGISNASTHSQIRREIHERISPHIHHKDSTPAPSEDTVTLMSLNMRGLKNKLTNIDGVDLFAYCKEQNVHLLNIQDHKIKESDAPFIQYAAKTGIPDMDNSGINMQHGHIGSRGLSRVGGTAQLCGGTIGKYRTLEIKDPRGWG